MKSLGTQSEEMLPARIIRRLVATVLLVGLAIYIGEKVIRANPDLIPVKAQLRASTNSGEFRPVPDPDVGFLGPPHLQVRVSTTNEYLQETDVHGFPNRPLPETGEIVVLGDSLVAGGVDVQFSTLVGQALSIKGVLNLGLAGAAPNRQLRAFQKFGASFRPRLVVSCVYLAADLDGQLKFDSWLKEGAKADYNQFRLELGGDLHPKSFWTRVQRKSFLAGKLTELALRWWGIPDRVSFPTGPDVLLDIDSLRLRASGLDRQDPRLLSMIESLKDIRALSQSQGANFLVLLIPSKEEIYGAPFMPEVMKPAQILEQRVKEKGFSVLSTYDTIRERAKLQSAFFPTDIHLNTFGNQIVSDSLVNWIKQTHSLSAKSNALKMNDPPSDRYTKAS
jgi:hypothetical protein